MDAITDNLQSCKSCNREGTGSYCSTCGQSYITKRITVSGLLHEVFHFFTHIEKGFGYTLKQLVVAPGTMQRLYMEGVRSRHQKPFSMFILCATINGVGRYWIYEVLLKYYHIGNLSEASFFHQYMVLLYAILMPVISLLVWVFFFKSKYNYAEIGVLQLYLFSAIFLFVTVIALLRFIWPHMDTAYVELPILIIYNSITFINFFNNSNRWLTLTKGIVLIIVIFVMAQKMEDLVIRLISNS